MLRVARFLSADDKTVTTVSVLVAHDASTTSKQHSSRCKAYVIGSLKPFGICRWGLLVSYETA